MKPPLRLAEALEIMDASARLHGRSFELVFCTADPRRDTGGERIVFDRAVLTTARSGNERPRGGPQKSTGATAATSEGTPRRRYQAKRFPVNVKNLTSQEIRKVRLDLIESVNGRPVL